jgi:hypothetical protein
MRYVVSGELRYFRHIMEITMGRTCASDREKICPWNSSEETSLKVTILEIEKEVGG